MDEHSKRVVFNWWQSMNLPTNELKDKHIPSAPTAQKAKLKRCESADDAMLSEGFRVLWDKLSDDEKGNSGSQRFECWATIAAVLVHVKYNTDTKFALAAGKKTDSDKPIVSEMRFSQLQNAKTPEDFLRRLRRIVQQIEGKVSVASLASDIHQWFAEYNQFRPRKADKRISVQWAMDYYRAAAGKSK